MVAVPAVFGYIGFVTDVSTPSAVGVSVLGTFDVAWWGEWMAEGGGGEREGAGEGGWWGSGELG